MFRTTILTRKLFPLALVLAMTLACNLVQKAKNAINEASKPKVVTSKNGRVQLTVPGMWRIDPELNSEADLQASNRLSELYVVVLGESKADFSDAMTLKQFTELTRSQMIRNLTSPEATAPVSVMINGDPAMQYELEGTVSNVKVKYINTTVETSQNYYQILTWTLPTRFEQSKSKLLEVTNSFKEVNAPQSQTSQPPPPAPVNSKPGGRRPQT